jgi:hypothetical protein
MGVVSAGDAMVSVAMAVARDGEHGPGSLGTLGRFESMVVWMLSCLCPLATPDSNSAKVDNPWYVKAGGGSDHKILTGVQGKFADPQHVGNKPSKFREATIEGNCPLLWVSVGDKTDKLIAGVNDRPQECVGKLDRAAWIGRRLSVLRRQLPVAISLAASVAMKAMVAVDLAVIEQWKSRIIPVLDWQNDLYAGFWERSMTVVNLAAQVGRVDAGVSLYHLVVTLLHELVHATPCALDGACAHGPAFVGGLRGLLGVLCDMSKMPSSLGDCETPLDKATRSLVERSLVIGKVVGGYNFVRLGDGTDIGWLGQQRLAAVLFGAGLPNNLVLSGSWQESMRVVRALSCGLRKDAESVGEGRDNVVWSCVETALLRMRGEVAMHVNLHLRRTVTDPSKRNVNGKDPPLPYGCEPGVVCAVESAVVAAIVGAAICEGELPIPVGVGYSVIAHLPGRKTKKKDPSFDIHHCALARVVYHSSTKELHVLYVDEVMGGNKWEGSLSGCAYWVPGVEDAPVELHSEGQDPPVGECLVVSRHTHHSVVAMQMLKSMFEGAGQQHAVIVNFEVSTSRGLQPVRGYVCFEASLIGRMVRACKKSLPFVKPKNEKKGFSNKEIKANNKVLELAVRSLGYFLQHEYPDLEHQIVAWERAIGRAVGVTHAVVCKVCGQLGRSEDLDLDRCMHTFCA